MDIGTKIRNARIKAAMTQEQVAEALGVSRQTVSNWENEKTYPDIVSVVKMSDLYDISLDILLKEEDAVSEYLNFLEESANTVKSKNKLSRLILLTTYLAIWASSTIVFWVFARGSDALGYNIMFLVVLLPVVTFIISFLIGKNNYWEARKWIFTVAFGVMYMLADYATFRAANMVAFHIFRFPLFVMLPIGALVSLAGMWIGLCFNKREPLKISSRY